MAYVNISYYLQNMKPFYEGISIHAEGDKKVFFTEDFVKDWYFATKFLIIEVASTEPTYQSSSVDTFIMDSAGQFKSVYLSIEDNIPVLHGDKGRGGTEYFIPKDSEVSTWYELRELVGDLPKPDDEVNHYIELVELKPETGDKANYYNSYAKKVNRARIDAEIARIKLYTIEYLQEKGVKDIHIESVRIDKALIEKVEGITPATIAMFKHMNAKIEFLLKKIADF